MSSVTDYLGLGSPVRISDGNGELIPQVFTFASILNTVSKTYSYRWDEAIRHNPENALAMRRDAYIRSLLQERSVPTVNREWNIKPDNQNDPVQKACASHLRAMIQQTPRFKRLLKYLMESLWYGRYGSQIKWDKRLVNGIERMVVVRHKPVNGDKIQGAWDDTPAVMINTMLANDERFKDATVFGDRNQLLLLNKRKWRDQFIIHTHEVEDADFFEGEMAGVTQGYGLRTMVYWSWWLRDEMLSWAVDFMKKVGTLGLLIFPYEMSNPASKAQAEANAKAASSSTALTMPVYMDNLRGGQSMQPMHIPASQYGVEALQRMVSEYFERHMERLVVGQSMSAGGGGAGGLEGDGRAEFARDTKFQLLHFDADNLAETLTDDLVKPMMRMNFEKYDFPMRFELVVEDPASVQKLQAAQTIVGMGVMVKEDEVREKAGFAKPEPDDKTVGGIEQLYAKHGEMKYLTPRGGLATNPNASDEDMGAGEAQREEPEEEPAAEEPLQLADDNGLELFGSFADPGDWRATKSGRGEYSPSLGEWRPRGSARNARQSQTHQAGMRIGEKLANSAADVIHGLGAGLVHPSVARGSIDFQHQMAVDAETKNFVNRYGRLKEQIGENYDESAFGSPEWKAVKLAHRHGLNGVLEHLGRIHKHTHSLADVAEIHGHDKIDDDHIDKVYDHLGDHRDAHKSAIDGIGKAVAAFIAKHKGKGGGGKINLSEPEFPELYREPEPQAPAHPFGPHSQVGQQSERQAKLEGIPAHLVHDMAHKYHKATGMHPTAAYRLAIDNFRLARSTWGGAGAADPKPAGKAPPPPRPPEAGGKPRSVKPGVADPNISGPQQRPSDIPFATPTNEPAVATAEPVDWRKTRSGRGEYSPSTGQWRPIGGGVRVESGSEEHHAKAAREHGELRNQHIRTMLDTARVLRSDPKFMKEAGKHLRLGALMRGERLGHDDLHELRDEVHEAMASHKGPLVGNLASAVNAVVENHERAAESKYYGEQRKATVAEFAKQKQSGGAGLPPREPDPEVVKKSSNIGAVRGKWGMAAMKAKVDQYSLHNRAGQYVNDGMDPEAAYQKAFDELTKKPDEKQVEKQQEREPGWDDDEPEEKPKAGLSYHDKAMEALRNHADMIRGTHNDEVDEHNSLVKEIEEWMARKWLESPHKYPHPQTVRRKLNDGRLDQAGDFPGFDELAEGLQSKYPHRLKRTLDEGGHDNSYDLSGQLFEILQQGRRKRMTRDEAERKALEMIEGESAEREAKGQKPAKRDEDEGIPFRDVSFVDLYKLIAA